jgi:predicted O-linked N-acetylglucosamine transferase (SPINDLY family)
MPKDVKEWGGTIRTDDLDILFFGNNTTAGVNSSTILGTHRLARRQCVHFCSPVTTGLKHVDYFLLGSLIDPEGKAETEYSEKLLRMPGSGICFSMGPQSKAIPSRFARRDFGIPENRALFVSGANFHKITPELRSIWARIIADVKESVLVLYPFGPAWSSSYPERRFTEELKAVFRRYGISRERLFILKPFEKQEHIKSFLVLADVYLDATPYSGATSLLDPLEAGVPPVVTEGPELRFCQGAAMLKELGVPDLVAESEEAYVRLAVRLGTDPDFRQAKSMEIREKMAQGPPFLDPRSYAEKVGKVLKSVMAARLK